jgi:RNA polymerase sigma-70 factor, ECF subfamily
MGPGTDFGGPCPRTRMPVTQPARSQRSMPYTPTDSVQATDWPQIPSLYDHLMELAPTPVIALNRAIAVGEVDGPEVALLLVDQLDLTGYYAFHATRADLLRRLGRYDQAVVAYETAAALATSTAERNHLIARVETFRERARSTH